MVVLAMACSSVLPLAACGQGASNNASNAAGFAGRTADVPAEDRRLDIVQQTRVNPRTKTVEIRIVRQPGSKVGGAHHGPQLTYRTQRVVVPAGWRIRVTASDARRALGVGIVKYPFGSIPVRYGSTLSSAQPGDYAVVSDASGAHGEILDFLIISKTVKTPTVQPG